MTRPIHVVGVNYASATMVATYCQRWAGCSEVKSITIVDCFSSSDERNEVARIVKQHGAKLVAVANLGYGNGLQAGLNALQSRIDENDLIIAGNVDVLPRFLGVMPAAGDIFMPKVFEGNRNRNPFMSKLQSRLLMLYEPALQTHPAFFIRMASLAVKIASIIPSPVWAVHGAVFVFRARAYKHFAPIFPPSIFMYCEELFFASWAEANDLEIVPVEWELEHVGGVSTESFYAGAHAQQIAHWAASFRAYLKQYR